MTSVDLPPPAFYFPPHKGRFTVTPGLFPLGTDFGNGEMDGCLFQIDRDYPRYYENKMRCRAERFSKYVLQSEFDPRTQEIVARLICQRLKAEYPTLFTWEEKRSGAGILHCALTGDALAFDDAMNLQAHPCYRDVFDALCCQIPEDIAIVRRRTVPESGEWVAGLHLCAPSHWAAEDKIGKPFVAVHAPVPHFDRIATVAESLTDSLIHRGPYVRFAWSVTVDNRLNAHPEPPPHLGPEIWDGESPLYLRVERQTLHGMPDVDAYLFGIRIYHYDLLEVCAEQLRRDALRAALQSMSPESQRYKGLADRMPGVLAYIDAL